MASETITQILQAIADKNGGVITPEEVVKIAEDKEHPLHQYFEWDDKQAAHRYRLDQARALIRTVKIRFVEHTINFDAPYFVRDPENHGRDAGYRTIGRLQTDQEAARDAVVQEFRRAASMVRRARILAAVLDQEDVVADLEKQIALSCEVIEAAVRASRKKSGPTRKGGGPRKGGPRGPRPRAN